MKFAKHFELHHVENSSQDTETLQRFLNILFTLLENKQAHFVTLKLKILDWVER